jgi:prepilin-type N-terminal cleavage/methylation domain-containing protein
MIARSRATPRGFTLIELLAVITSLSVLMGLCALTIQLLMRVSSEAQARRSASATLGRLAEQFREDVHGCDEAQLRPSAGLRLSRGPRFAISYEARDGRVERVESTGGQASRRETYALGKGGSAVFQSRDDGPRRFLALLISQGTRPGRPDPARPIEILALVGKDRPEPPRSKGGPAR